MKKKTNDASDFDFDLDDELVDDDNEVSEEVSGEEIEEEMEIKQKPKKVTKPKAKPAPKKKKVEVEEDWADEEDEYDDFDYDDDDEDDDDGGKRNKIIIASIIVATCIAGAGIFMYQKISKENAAEAQRLEQQMKEQQQAQENEEANANSESESDEENENTEASENTDENTDSAETTDTENTLDEEAYGEETEEDSFMPTSTPKPLPTATPVPVEESYATEDYSNTNDSYVDSQGEYDENGNYVGANTTIPDNGEVSVGMDTENTEPAELILLGDSRFRSMHETATDINGAWECSASGDYDWMMQAFSNIDGHVGEGTKILINVGINDLQNVESYAVGINTKAAEWTEKGAKVFFVSVCPVGGNSTIPNNDIANFNTYMYNNLELDKVGFIDAYNYLVGAGYETIDASNGVDYSNVTLNTLSAYLMDLMNQV